MKKKDRTSMSFRERLSAAIALTLLLVTYQQISPGNSPSLSQTIRKVLPSISSFKIFPEYEFLVLP
ncbi:MAG: hypothetical protein QNJ41_04640 [Xenococcaceae cyanobacterium MO_188.B32]|nr:hypothetical protein [Xenococcaceae cyanobacterium MO_188.B32]